MISPLSCHRQLTRLHAAVKNDIKTVIQWLDQEAESCVQSQLAGSPSNDQVQQKHSTKGEKRRKCYTFVYLKYQVGQVTRKKSSKCLFHKINVKNVASQLALNVHFKSALNARKSVIQKTKFR